MMIMKRTSIYIVFVFLLFQSIQSIANDYEKILPPDNNSGRNSYVLDKTILVRLIPGKYDFEDLKKLFEDYNLNCEKPLLSPKQSITYRIGEPIIQSKYDKRRLDKILEIESLLLRTFKINYNQDISPEEMCRWVVKNIPIVESAEPYFVDEILYKPNDPLIDQQSMLEKIKAFEAWSVYDGDTSVVILINDNGLFQKHEDLEYSIAPNWDEIPFNGIDDDGNGYIDDFIGYNLAYTEENSEPGDTFNQFNDHGSNSGGIAGATFNNGRGMAGTAGKCRIFPLKNTTSQNWRYTKYGYEGIIYAAVNEFPVMNCSWGSENTYSDFKRTIVEYAIARDVAIVAAAGNSNNSILPYYPAGFYGVLGVGEVVPNDMISAVTNLGAHVDIMAPGMYNYQTTNVVNGYSQSPGGTSSAAPVVAGVVALVRAKYDELYNLQALELVRQSTDDISEKNFGWEDIVPGRINMLKALTTHPFSIPGIRPVDFKFLNSQSKVIDRFSVNDTVFLEIQLYNYLGPANSLRFVLSTARDEYNRISVLNNEIKNVSIEQDSPFELSGFTFKVNQIFDELMFLRVDIYGEKNYHDFFLLPINTLIEVTTFENELIKFSVGDRGTFGFSGSDKKSQGFGFVYKGFDNQLYRGSGIMATESNIKSISAIHGSGPNKNDFGIVKAFSEPNRMLGVINDNFASQNERIGIEISQNYYLPPSKSWAKNTVTVKNTNTYSLKDLAVGFLIDWDLNNDGKNNRVALLPEAIPQDKTGKSAAAEYVYYYKDGFPVFGSAVYSNEINAIAQAAGLDADITFNFSKSDQIKALNSGTDWQTNKIADVSYVIGMRFTGELQPGETKKFILCTGVGNDKDDLALALRECLDSELSVMDDNFNREIFELYPNPADDLININFTNLKGQSISLKIVNALGKVVGYHSYRTDIINNGTISLPVKYLSPGFYSIIINCEGKLFYGKFIKLP